MPESDSLLLGRYRLVKNIGQGGMSVVVLATDIKDGKQVAIKVLSTHSSLSEEVKLRFRKEARMLAKLSHPHIVRILDYDEIKGRPCLVLEWIGNGTLSDQMGRPHSYQSAAAFLAPVAEALHYAHDQGIIHRDVKPSNILIDEHGDPLLTDFGIAKLSLYQQVDDQTITGMQMGTPEYMAPEQALGQAVSPSTDIYALGVILYELLTGRKPYKADTPFGTMLQHSTQPLPPPSQIVSDIPEEVERVLHKALAKDPAERYQSMAEFGVILKKLAGGQPLTPEEAPPLPKKTEPVEAPHSSTQWLRAPLLAQVKFIPRWALIVLVLVLFGVGVLPRLRGSVAFSENQLAYLSIVQGDVQVSDGQSVSAARQGALIAETGNAQLKTRQGYVNLELRDGAVVVMDQSTTIVFPPQDVQPATDQPAFNLVYGRVLVINGQDSHGASHVFVASLANASVYHGVMGLSVQTEGDTRQEIDCLVGPCQTNIRDGQMELASGQRLLVSADGETHATEGIQYETWASLGGVAVPTPTRDALLAQAQPTITWVFLSTPTGKSAKVLVPITSADTPTATQTTSPSPYPSNTWLPIWTSTSPPHPSSTPIPTRTKTPVPTATWTRTTVPLPSSTATPLPGDTAVPTLTSTSGTQPTPTETIAKPTKKNPTATDTFTPVPTDVPTATDTPVPANTAIPTDLPTDGPSPTPT